MPIPAARKQSAWRWVCPIFFEKREPSCTTSVPARTRCRYCRCCLVGRRRNLPARQRLSGQAKNANVSNAVAPRSVHATRQRCHRTIAREILQRNGFRQSRFHMMRPAATGSRQFTRGPCLSCAGLRKSSSWNPRIKLNRPLLAFCRGHCFTQPGGAHWGWAP